MTRILTRATTEFRIALRNRWVTIAVVMIVRYDLALLAAVLAAGGGWFTAQASPRLLVANPADAFRLPEFVPSARPTPPAVSSTGTAGALSRWTKFPMRPCWRRVGNRGQPVGTMTIYPCACARFRRKGRTDMQTVPRRRFLTITACAAALGTRASATPQIT